MKTIHTNVRVPVLASDLRPGMPYGYRQIEKISLDQEFLRMRGRSCQAAWRRSE